MKTEKINQIEILDENSNQISEITLKFSCEINIDNIVVSNFEIIEIDNEVLILQFCGENKAYDLYDVDESVAELIECIKIEAENDNIIDDNIYDEIYEAIKSILTPVL